MALCGGQGGPPPRAWQERGTGWGLWQERSTPWGPSQERVPGWGLSQGRGYRPGVSQQQERVDVPIEPVRWRGAQEAQVPDAVADVSLRLSALKSIAMSISIVRLDGGIEPEVSAPPEDRLVAGDPEHRVWNHFTDSTQQFFAGRWAATRGKWRVRYTENELCVMTAGRVVIESTSGERYSFGAGDAFVIPAGFEGTWEVIEDCSKVYAIFQAQS